jgi:hypothetical protein
VVNEGKAAKPALVNPRAPPTPVGSGRILTPLFRLKMDLGWPRPAFRPSLRGRNGPALKRLPDDLDPSPAALHREEAASVGVGSSGRIRFVGGEERGERNPLAVATTTGAESVTERAKSAALPVQWSEGLPLVVVGLWLVPVVTIGGRSVGVVIERGHPACATAKRCCVYASGPTLRARARRACASSSAGRVRARRRRTGRGWRRLAVAERVRNCSDEQPRIDATD